MPRHKRRIPRYKLQDLEFQEREAKRKKGFPADAIVADLSQQAPNNSYSKLEFYRDVDFQCADCGKPQVWTAAQQKWWYEVGTGSIYSRAKRCRECRAAFRTANRPKK